MKGGYKCEGSASLDNSACREKEIQRETYQVQLEALSYMLALSGTLARCL